MRCTSTCTSFSHQLFYAQKNIKLMILPDLSYQNFVYPGNSLKSQKYHIWMKYSFWSLSVWTDLSCFHFTFIVTMNIEWFHFFLLVLFAIHKRLQAKLFVKLKWKKENVIFIISKYLKLFVKSYNYLIACFLSLGLWVYNGMVLMFTSLPICLKALVFLCNNLNVSWWILINYKQGPNQKRKVSIDLKDDGLNSLWISSQKRAKIKNLFL